MPRSTIQRHQALDDLVIADDSGVRVIHGRDRNEWIDLADAMALAMDANAIPNISVLEATAGWSVAGVGDVTRDGRNDIAMVSSGELRIYSGGGLPDALSLVSTITGLPADVEVFNAGDVDGDAANDLLITGDGGHYLVFGGDLPVAETLANLLVDPDGDGPQLVSALELPDGAWKAIGDFDGADSEGNAYADLGAAVLVATDRLNESAQLEHQVVNIYLGGDRASLAEAFETEDIVIEPGRAFFFQQDTVSPSAAFFGGAVEVSAKGTVITTTEGSAADNEVQSVSHTGVGGTFTLSLGADTTAAIDYNATATDVESALEALGGITDVEVTGVGTEADPWVVTFIDPGNQDVAEMTFNGDGLLPAPHTLLAVTGPAGDSLRLYDGTKFGVVDGADVSAAGLEFDRDLFVLPLATPVPPGFVPSPPPGVDLANDSNSIIRDAFVLEGVDQNERLANSQALPDFNGDGFGELLITGEKASYLFLGPVQLDDIHDVESQADVIIDAEVGRAASRMGDVTGDGLSDLVFLRSIDTEGGFAITIIAGGLANGTDLPRHVTLDWVNELTAESQLRVYQRTLIGFGAGWASASASIGVMNWNDDGNADIALVRASAVDNGIQGLVLSGNNLLDGLANRDLENPDVLTFITRDLTSASDIATEMGVTGVADSAVTVNQVRAGIAGDVTGDGLDDLLLVDAGASTFPFGSELSGVNIGRGYLITGRIDGVGGFLSLGTDSELIIQDYALGGSLAALGDLNRDGYDDFAIGSNREALRETQGDTDREGGLFIFLGQADFGGETVRGEGADIVVTRTPSAELPVDGAFLGALQATAGDFDGDRKMDLVVSEPTRLQISDGTLNILDLDQSGTVSVFYNVMTDTEIEGQQVISLTNANRTLVGDFEFDALGALATTPAFDLDNDGLDDLVIGASGADVVTGDVIPAGGKVYVVYGSSSRAALPANAIELGNRSITGAGFFLVDEGTGRPTLFRDAPGEDDPLFMLQNGGDLWYTFTTLADGMPGNRISIIPEAIDGFLAPIDSDSSLVPIAQPVGNELFSRPLVDGAIGSMFVGDEITVAGRITTWSVFSGTFGGSPRHVTPIIFKEIPGGGYEITGIGEAEEIASNTPQEFEFRLASGSDAVGEGYYLGWYDGSAATGDNQGAIGYSGFGDTVQWFGPDQGAAGNLVAGAALTPVNSFVRTYSIGAGVTSGAVLEFDLGRFLGWAGDPDAVGSAKLILDAPTAAAAVAAPTSIAGVTFSAGKLYFSAFTPEQGHELWVTNVADGETHLIEDLNPGTVGSFPTNMIDVGGTLYFTANAGVSGTKLYSTDGTTVNFIDDVPGFPSSFTTQTGFADLLAASAGPVDGVPDVDYSFVIDILRENGTVDSVEVTLPRSETTTNATVADLFTDLNTALSTALLNAGLTGDLSLTQVVDKFELTGIDPDIVSITVRDGVRGGLGFASNEASQPNITMDAAGPPTAFDVVSDVAFSLELSLVGGSEATFNFLLNADATDGNASAADLADDIFALINPVLVANGFADDAIQVVDNGGNLQLLLENDLSIFQVVIKGGEPFGFGTDQASARSVSVTSTNPATPKLPADLTFSVAILTSDGQVLEHDITLPGSENESNNLTSDPLETLGAQLETALNAAFAGDFSVLPLSVINSGGSLQVTSRDSSIVSVSLEGAGELGFTDEGQTSVRSGDRMFFTTFTTEEGQELYKVEGGVITLFDVYPGLNNSSSPSNLTVIDNTLYFAANDATGRFLWQSVDGATPEKIAGQTTFSSPSHLINAGGVLAFSALPNGGTNDRQVYSYDVSTFAFTRLSNITPGDTTSNPNGLTYFNGKIYFQARDHQNGDYDTGSGFTGTELWEAIPGDDFSAQIAANIAGDSDPEFFSFFGIPILITPGNVASS